ncbi:hypothetical protein EN879_38680, partial [Mesorhizobium sp. M7A.F.Ca.AU.002.02.1.1]
MVTIYDAKPGLSRRELLKRGGIGALLVISGSAVISPEHAWGLETSALKPETMATLIQMARDIYPHDQVPDKYYAIAVKGHDEQRPDAAAFEKLTTGKPGLRVIDRDHFIPPCLLCALLRVC